MPLQLHLIIDLGVVDHVGADIVAAHLRSVLLHTIKQMESKIIYLQSWNVYSYLHTWSSVNWVEKSNGYSYAS